MNGLYQTYLDNLAATGSLLKPVIRPDMTREQALQQIRDCAEGLFRIHQENDQILKDILFSKEPDTLTADEAAQLIELADALFNHNRSPDTGIAYRIHKLLFAYAQFHQNTDLCIRELYYQGITLFYLNVRDTEQGINLFLDQIGDYFQAGASYLERYEEFQSPQTRSYILRCLGNLKYGLKSFQGGNDGQKMNSILDGWEDYMACFNRAMDIFLSPHYRQMNPEIPWDTFAYTMHYDRTQFLSGLRQESNPVIAQAVMESASYVYRHQEQTAKANEKAIGIRTRYVYMAAKYHAGLAALEELMEELFQICEGADPHNISSDNIWAILYTPEYLMHYSKDLSPEQLQLLQPRLQGAFEKQKRYLFLLPQNEYGMQISRTIRNVAKYLSSREVLFFQQLLDYILACHPPTFVHSQMVALLTRRLCEQMAKVCPELLSGTFGFQGTEQVLLHLDQLLDLAYHGGLYHDLGKCMLLSYVGLYSRRLLDEEFACIKLHVSFGCKILENFQMKDMEKIAYYHHRTYDRNGGYPRCEQECPPHIRRIVDIVTVVDSLDAGTDNVGRSYAASKTYEQLVGELQAGKGTRYAPEVVELFDDPNFYEETKQFLLENRNQVYLNVYSSQ